MNREIAYVSGEGPAKNFVAAMGGDTLKRSFSLRQIPYFEPVLFGLHPPAHIPARDIQ